MTPTTRYSLYVVFSALAAAMSNILTEIALRFIDASPPFLTFTSDLIGALVLLLPMVLSRESNHQHWKKSDWLRVIAAALAIYVLSFLLRFESVNQIGASKSVLLSQLGTIFVVVLAFIFLGERWTIRHWIAGLLAISGTILINFDPGELQFHMGLGEILATLAALSVATGIVLIKPLLDRQNGQWTTGLALLFGAVFLAPALPFFGTYNAVWWHAALIITTMGVIRGLSWSTYNVSMQHIGASRSAIIFQTTVFFTVTIQVTIDKLVPDLGLQVPDNLITAVIGGIIIALGVIILQKDKNT